MIIAAHTEVDCPDRKRGRPSPIIKPANMPAWKRTLQRAAASPGSA